MSEQPTESKVPYEQYDWEQDWIQDNDGKYAAARSRGMEVLHRIKAELPLSPREEAVAQQVNNNPNWQQYRDEGSSEEHLIRLMGDNIGTMLTTEPKKPEFYDDPELRGALDTTAYDIWQLSDVRSPEVTNNNTMNQEGEQ